MFLIENSIKMQKTKNVIKIEFQTKGGWLEGER
jgi:hypothetical protein